MGYLHIENLYKYRRLLEFRRVYAMEKIHGTSCHVRRIDGKLHFFSGGEVHERFVALFDKPALESKLQRTPSADIYIYGEAYGGKQQGMADVYGPELKFIVFDVQINGEWMEVPRAEKYAKNLGLEFVHYELVDADIETLNKERDKPSVQAARNGMGIQYGEGIVIRPPFECMCGPKSRVIAKHKREAFRETSSPRQLSDAELKVLEDAEEIAQEWVTDMRLTHVLDKLTLEALNMKAVSKVIEAMQADIVREAEEEIVVTPEALRAIGKQTAALFQNYLKNINLS